ncbi:MAG: hypothetical protein AABY22_27855 [Nanoarchaeota archaeon]
MKDHCECCGSEKELVEKDAERKDRKIFKITICNKCLFDYSNHKF